MKVGIVGDAKRAVAWEQHLRSHKIIQEVDLCPNIKDVGSVDACLIIDDSEQNLEILLEGIRCGLNCFLISKQPSDKQKLANIHHAANEAGVLIQLSHWPTLAPATQWMMNRISRPSVLSISREVAYSQWINSEEEFKHLWMDELGLCVKWVDSGIHQIEAKQLTLHHKQPMFIHLFLRFDNGTTADISVYAGAAKSRHQRIISTKHEILDCDVPTQQIRIGSLNSAEHIYYEKQHFDPAKSAEKAALVFLKSIQMNQETAYSSYDAYQLAVQLERVQKRLKQFG